MRSIVNRRAGKLLVVIALVANQACDRRAPTENHKLTPALTTPQADLAPGTLGKYQIPVPPENNRSNHGGGAPYTYTGIRIPAYTAYVIAVNGRVSTTKNPAWYCQGTFSWPYDGHDYGPLGTGTNYDLLVNLRVWNLRANLYVPFGLPGTGGASGPTEVKSDTAFTWDDLDLEAGRNGIAFACDDVGGYLMSGSQTLTVEEITNTLRLTPPEYYVHPGTRVSFTASMADGSPLSTTINWAWMADSLHARSVGGICGTNANPCSVTPTVSGTVRVVGNVLGKMREAKGHVTVYQDFTLESDSTSAHPLSNVKFTPKLDGKTAKAARWRWAPQDPTVQDNTTCTADSTCVKQMVTTGTMWAYLAASGGDSASATVSLVADGGCGSTSFAKSPRGISLDCTSDPPHVVVTADRSTVVALDSVTFTAEVYSSGAHVTAVGWSWVPKLGSTWDPWTKACSGVELTCKIQLHGTGDMTYSVRDDDNTLITGTVHVIATIPDDVGDDNLVGEDPLVSDGSSNSAGVPVDASTSAIIAVNGIMSGEWFYTQGCAQCKGGSFTEPAVNLANHYGDCTDFVWYAISTTLGASWPHSYDDEKMSTKMYNSRDSTELAAHGFLQVDSASVRAGDVVVRTKIGGSGHAGLFIGWIASDASGEYTNGFPGGWANNGWPATHDAEGHNGLTTLFSFTPQNGTVTKFFRPLRSSQ